MAISAVLRNTRFPVGTSVKAYTRDKWPQPDPVTGAPPGSPTAAATATVQTDRTLTFTGLTAGIWYYAHATVGGREVVTRFKAGSTSSAQPRFDEGFTEGQIPEWDEPTGQFVPSAGASGIPATLIDAKGDLIVGSAADTAARLAVGSNDQVLTAASAQATGVKWAAAAGGGIAATIVDAKGDIIAATAADAVARVAVGADGRVLTADSGAAAGVSWAKAVPGGARQASGRYYYPGAGPVIAAAAALTLNSLRCFPLAIGRAVSLDRIGINITTLGASSTVRLGIYSDDGNGAPGALLLDAGTIDSTTTGLKEITINQAVPVDWIWLAFAAQGGTPPQAPMIQGLLPPMGYVAGTQTSSTAMSGYIHSASTSGALPATFLPTTTGQANLVVVRVA